MFGYVRPYAPDMKVREYEIYRAIYCGVCREIGRTSGQLSRLGLTYDIVLLCAVRMVLTEEPPTFKARRCPAHPLTRRTVLEPCEATRFTAAAFALLFGAKNDDDLADEHGVHRLKPLALAPLAAHMKKAGGRVLSDDAAHEAARFLGELSRLERVGSPSADETSDAFGDLLGYIFSLGLDGERAETARVFGRSVGKFIYMCDALDDLGDDIRRGRYNPLLVGWGDLAAEDGLPSPIVKDAVTTATMLSLEELGRAAETLDDSHPMTPIVKHIVYIGLPYSLRRVLDGRRSERKGSEELLQL